MIPYVRSIIKEVLMATQVTEKALIVKQTF